MLSSEVFTCAWVACHCPTTDWNWLAAPPRQASSRAVSRPIIACTCPSMSPAMRVMSADAAWMRSVSTWNCAVMGPPPLVDGTLPSAHLNARRRRRGLRRYPQGNLRWATAECQRECQAVDSRPSDSPPVEPPVWDAAEFSEPLVFGGANPRAQRMAAGRESIPRRR